MTGKDFQGKGVPVYASRKIMRCVCDAAECLAGRAGPSASSPATVPEATLAPRNPKNLRGDERATPQTNKRDRLAESVLACSYFSLLHRSEIDLLLPNTQQKQCKPGRLF